MTDPARWLSAEIPGWREPDRREKRSIRDLPILWALFELHATGQNGQDPNATPERICSTVTQLVEPIQLSGEMKNAKAYFAGRYFADGYSTPAWEHLRMKRRFHDQVRLGLVTDGAGERQVLLALLLVVNRLRNNFLHGEKARYAFRGQYENFRHANNVLVAAIELWPRPI